MHASRHSSSGQSQAQQRDGIGLIGRPQRGLHDAVLVYGICVCISKRFCGLLLKCPQSTK